MQITLNQTEIEEAIRQFIDKRMTLQEGAEIVLDLKATRGTEGFTATLDIVEPGMAAPAPVEAAPAPAPVPRKPRQVLGAQTQPAPVVATPAAPAAQETAQDDAGDAQPETATAVEASAPEAATAADGAQEEANEEAPAPTTPPKSLFGNLQRPKNT